MTSINARLRALLVDEASGTWLGALHPSDDRRVRAHWEAAVESGEPFQAHARLLTADGAYRLHTIEAEPVCDEAGCVTAWSGTIAYVHDPPETTGARLAAAPASAAAPADVSLLRDHEATLRLALDAGDLGVWTLNPATRRFSFDRRCQHVFGLPAKVSAQTVLRRVHADDRAAVEAALKAAIGGARSYDVHHRFLLPDGEVRWLHVVGRAEVAEEQREADPEASRVGRRVVGVVRDVTEQMEAEAAQRASTRLFKAIVDQMPAGVSVAEAPSGRFILYNEEAARLLGHALLPTNHYSDFTQYGALHEDGRPYAPEEYPLVRALYGETVRQEEMRYRRGDGRVTTLLVNAAPVRHDDGRIVLAVSTFYDIADRKQAADELRASEQRFRDLADNIPQLAWMADADGSIYWFNKRWYDYTGTSLEEVQGWSWRRVHHPDHVDRVVARITRAFEAGRPWEDTFPMRSHGGTYHWFLSRAMPIRDEDGRIVRWFGTHTDVTEQLQLEEALVQLTETLEEKVAERTAEIEQANRELRAARDRFGKAFHASPIASCIIRQQDGRLLDLNTEFARLFGYDRERALGHTTTELGLQADPADRPLLLGRLEAEGGIRDVEIDLRAREGDVRTLLLSMEPIDLDGEACTLSMFVDITERKRSEEAVRQLSSALTLAEQRERRRLSMILHDDLQQILFGAELQLAILRYGIRSESPTLDDQAETVRGLLKRGIELTRAIALDLNPPILKGEGLPAALAWLCHHMHEVHGLQVELETEGDMELPDEEHRVLAVQLVRELLFNVVKHAEVDRARVLARQSAGRIVIAVEDEGRGFEVSETLGNRARRSSLGLFSVEERLQLVGGRLKIRSAPGEGSRVEIMLPT